MVTPPHSASCLSVSPVSVPVGGRKNTTGASCNGWNHHGCKGSLCANGWGRNTTTVSCRWWLPLQAQGGKVRVQGAKVRTSISTSRNGIQQQHTTPTTTNIDQLGISTGTGGVHDAAINATCVRAHNKGRAWKELELCALTQVALIAASCTPPAPVLIRSWSMVVVVGVASCCCILFWLVLIQSMGWEVNRWSQTPGSRPRGDVSPC